MAISISFEAERWPLKEPFRFAGHNIQALDTVHVVVSDGTHHGHGEGVIPIVFEVTLEQSLAALNATRAAIMAGGDAAALCTALPAGPARNALDCALWDIDAKAARRSIWDLAGLGPAPASLHVDQSIGLADPQAMAAAAAASLHQVLKIKLDTALVIERVAAIRRTRPDATIIVDANQAWDAPALARYAPALAELGVAMIEQPLPAGSDHGLAHLTLPLPIFADESCHTRADLAAVAPLYDGINIKLDKTGGLTEALALAHAARSLGLELMVGCMAGTSLSMAPAYVVASLCAFADLDGPLLLAHDRNPPMTYRDGRLNRFPPALWG